MPFRPCSAPYFKDFSVATYTDPYYVNAKQNSNYRGMMMLRKGSIFGSLVCTALLLALTIGMGPDGLRAEDDEMCLPLGTITLEAPADVEAKRSPVEFPHGAHFDFSCKECHHTWEGDEPIMSCQTSGCHDLVESPYVKGEKPDPEEVQLYYKNAYHKSCIGCHKEINKANKAMAATPGNTDAGALKSGPTSCNACHPKE
jgi:hypothetical protein